MQHNSVTLAYMMLDLLSQVTDAISCDPDVKVNMGLNAHFIPEALELK